MGRHRRDLGSLLEDLLAWCVETEAFVKERTAEDLMKDRTAELALTRLIEVVGEISGNILRLHRDWCEENAVEDLLMAYRMRNRIAHGYDDIRPDLLYDVAAVHIPLLSAKARTWLDRPGG